MDEKDSSDLRISKSAVRQMAVDACEEIRITDEACNRVALQEEKRIQRKVELARKVADRAGRKTVREEDLMVVESILQSELPP